MNVVEHLLLIGTEQRYAFEDFSAVERLMFLGSSSGVIGYLPSLFDFFFSEDDFICNARRQLPVRAVDKFCFGSWLIAVRITAVILLMTSSISLVELILARFKVAHREKESKVSLRGLFQLSQ
ncbi:hypothetical protein AVEN_113498-1 [Araneus ventricosus]|uniref:Uncharacterized protein n=1 Tax=Araneus ventricosus TaxID=182803 RepID=A0A4Y2GDD8_ARAVE|nr:hypothetical protein AVEN_113498-1 [Araneus ventricosus]